MAWSNSKVFMAFIEDVIEDVADFDMDGHTFTVALYDNDITPDQTVSAANSAYNAGQWTSSGNEVFEAGQWAQGGVNLAGVSSSRASNVYTFDANDTASGSAADLANVFGCLVYDNTIASPVADQGLSYHYFGGSNSVVNGTFTVIWAGAGIVTITA